MKSRRCTSIVLTALLVLALVPSAFAAVDYSKNAAGGDYAPATGPTVAAEPAASADSGFDWGAAALGAGAAVIVIALVTGLRNGAGVIRSRRSPA